MYLTKLNPVMKKILFLFSAGLAIPPAFGQTTPSATLQPGAVITLPANASPADIAIVDVDHDGRPDLGVAQRGLNSVAVYRQASNGSYTLPPAVYAVGLGPSALVALDFGYTGKNVDLVVACGGDGTFYPLSNANLPDGTLKVGGTSYYYGPSYAPNPRLAAGYIDRDAKPDLLFGLAMPNPCMFSWNYQGLDAQNMVVWEGSQGIARTNDVPSGVLLGDLDGDAFPDIAASLPGIDEVTVFRNDGSNASFPYFTALGSPVHVPTLGRGPIDLTAADLNQDSRPDLLTANGGDNTVSLMLGTNAAKFGTAVLIHQAAAPRKVLALDLDGDQRPELITINADNTLNVYHNTGLAGPDRYGTPLTLPTGLNPVALRMADFNGDRRLDLAVACAGDNTVRLYYNTTGTALATAPSAVRTPLVVFPNPASTQLRFQRPAGMPGTTPLAVTLLDMTGRQVLTQTLLGTEPLDVSQLARGMYIARVMSPEGLLTQKVELQ